MKCQRCHKRYPNRFMDVLHTTDYDIVVDPICALEEINEIHGSNRTEFKGGMAQEKLQEFVRWAFRRKKLKLKYLKKFWRDDG